MNKATQLILIFTLVAVIITATFFYVKKKGTTSASASTGNLPAAGTATPAGNVVTLPATDTTAATPSAATGPNLSTGVTGAMLGAATKRPTLPAQGNVDGMVTKYGITKQQALEYLTYDCSRNNWKSIQNWVPDWTINNPNEFATRWALYTALSDMDYYIAYGKTQQ